MPSQFNAPIASATDGATVEFNFAVSKEWQVTVAGSRTVTMINPDPGDFVLVKIIQDATGSRTITWPASVKWAGGSAPTLTITASKADMIYFYYDGKNFYDVAIKLNY